MYYKYGTEEITYLTKKDEILGLYIKETGMLKRPLEKTYLSHWYNQSLPNKFQLKPQILFIIN